MQFVITANNTALVESWRLTQADLTGANGTADMWTWDCVFQEIQLGDSREEDELLFEWSSLEGGVSPSETYFEVVRRCFPSVRCGVKLTSTPCIERERQLVGQCLRLLSRASALAAL